MMRNFLFSCLLLLPLFSAANHQFCTSARVVCDITEQPSEGSLCNSSCAGDNNLVNGGNSCFTSGLTRWGFYMFTIKQSGTLTFNIAPQNVFPLGSDNYNFALFDVSNGCGNLGNALRCSINDDGGAGDPTGLNMSATDTSEGTGGDGFCKYLDVVCGHTYILCLDIPSNGGAGFDLSFGGTCLLGAPQTPFNANPSAVCASQPVNFSPDTTACYVSNPFIAYNWDFGANGTPSTFTGVNPPAVTFSSNGVQTITLTTVFSTAEGSCTSVTTQNVTVSNNLSGTTSSTPASCGASNGTAAVSVSGGNTPFTYLWDDASSQTTATATGLAAGTYSVTFTNADGCTGTATATVSGGSGLNVTGASTNVLCNGICTGTVSASATGGATPYIFAWSGGLGSGANISNVCAGTYTVTGTDNNGCTGTATATVTQPASALSVTTTCVDESFPGSNDGSSSSNPSGGTSPYSYLWSSGQTTQNITGINAGTYNITVTDANGCTATAVCNISAGSSCPVCMLPGWQYIKEITIDNSGISNSYTNFQELIILDTQTPISQGKMNASGNDIRFVDGDCSTQLCYYIESGMNTANTQIWVKLPSLAANTVKTIYLFYGNSGAAAQSSFSCVFPNVLTINSATTLGGTQNYDWIDLQAGGSISIPSGQILTLNARKVIIAGNINGNSAGYGPQAGPGAGCNGGGGQGGSGGSYGGVGGTGGGCGSPAAYGTANGTDLDMGSGGGGSDCSPDAPGGGAVKIVSSVAVVNGNITMNGANANYCCCGNSSEAAGGGSGGGIMIQGDYVSGSASLAARGGNGGDSDTKEGGGGGAGGSVKIFYCKSNTFSGGANVNGGSNGVGGQSGQQPGQAGTFTTNTFACEAISIGLEQYAVFADAGNDTVYCSGNNPTIGTDSTSGYTYSWSPTTGLSSSSVSNPTVSLTNTSLTPLVTDFIVTTTANNCSSSDTVTVTVNAMPVSDAGADIAFCSGSTQTIGTTSTAGYTYSWSPTTGLSNATISNPTVIIINNGSADSVINYVVTTTSTGCVTTDTVQVTVYPLPTSTFSALGPICVEEGLVIAYTGNADTATATFIWDFDSATSVTNITGETYLVSWDTSGNKNITLTVVQNGCLSSQTNIVVIVNPPNANAGPDQSFCSGDTITVGIPPNAGYTYSWSPAAGLSSSSDGNPTLSLTNTTASPVIYDYVVTTTYVGCTVSDTVSVTVNPEPVPGVFANGNICSGNSTLIGTASNSDYSYSWSPSTGLSSATVSSPNVSLTYSGTPSAPDTTYSYSITTTYTAYGCFVTDTATVTVYQIPASTFTVAPDSVCIGESATITYTGNATTGANYNWNFSGGTATPATGAGPMSVVWSSAGNMNVTLQVTENNFSCPSTVTSVSVVVKPLPVSNAGNDAAFCSGSSASIGASAIPTYSYSWNPGAGLDNSTSSNPTVTLSDNTLNDIDVYDYIVTTTSLGCATSDTVQVTVYPYPDAAYIAPLGQCESGNSFSFSNTSTFLTGATFQWNFGLNTSPPTSTAQNPSGVVFPAAGTYPVSLTVSQYGCTDTVFVDSIQVYSMPSINAFANDYEGCEPFSVNFFSTVTADAPAVYQWNFGDFLGDTVPNPQHTYLDDGTYDATLYVESVYGCDTVSSIITIVVNPKPEANYSFTPAHITNLNPVVNFTDESFDLISGWFWDFKDSTMSFDQNPVHTFADTGNYFVMLIVTNQYDCKDTAIDTITILPDYNLFVPNAFTPNNDGMNDYFAPVAIGIDYSEFEMVIYDRWGELIFVTQNPDNAWDGTHDGKPVKQDVYVWKIALRDLLKKEHTYAGHVSVIR